MLKLKTLGACAVFAAAGLMGAASAQAAPLANFSRALAVPSDVIHVHGCHRDWRRGPRGGMHRHVGPRCIRVNAREFRQRVRPRNRQNCVRVGPVWLCD